MIIWRRKKRFGNFAGSFLLKHLKKTNFTKIASQSALLEIRMQFLQSCSKNSAKNAKFFPSKFVKHLIFFQDKVSFRKVFLWTRRMPLFQLIWPFHCHECKIFIDQSSNNDINMLNSKQLVFFKKSVSVRRMEFLPSNRKTTAESPANFCLNSGEHSCFFCLFLKKLLLLRLFLWTRRIEFRQDCQLFFAEILRIVSSCFFCREKRLPRKVLLKTWNAVSTVTPETFCSNSWKKILFQTFPPKLLSWKLECSVCKPAAKFPPQVPISLSKFSQDFQIFFKIKFFLSKSSTRHVDCSFHNPSDLLFATRANFFQSTFESYYKLFFFQRNCFSS